jgi:uncharacterized membrane protein (UPF0127 family)
MTRRHLLALLAAGPILLPAAVRAAYAEPTGPQPELAKETLSIVTQDGQKHEFRVEMALTPEQQAVGMMFRVNLAPDSGMLFDWGSPRRSQMWMRNTVSSLDMLFIDEAGVIRRVAERTVPYSLAVVDSLVPVRATLEVPAGTAERLDIRVGDKVLHKLFGTGG